MQTDIAIIGAGLAGLGMAARLRKDGRRSFVVLDRNPDVGGVWYSNRYPGCACDIPTALYSYSFERKWRWRESFASSDHIREYLRHCVEEYGLREHIRTNTQIVAARFDASKSRWQLRTADGQAVTCHKLICASGTFNEPSIPALPGLNDFKGEAFHSARWPQSFDPSGRNIAVIGTGASAVQLIPALAQHARRLRVFQGTPPWILPKLEPSLTRLQRWLLRSMSPQRAMRMSVYWRNERFGRAMQDRGEYLSFLEWVCRSHIDHQIADPELRRKVTPDYRLGCNTLLISNDYYPALTRNNVSLTTDRVHAVQDRAVIMRDGTAHEVDTIVFATGFNIGGAMSDIDFIGANDVRLHDRWSSEGREAYLGIAMTDFPNFFMLGGPNSGTAHTSFLFMLEAQMDYVLKCLRWMDRGKLQRLEVKAEAQRRYNRMLQERMPATIWASGCSSWFRDAQGKNFTMWPGSSMEYWWRTRWKNSRDFETARH